MIYIISTLHCAINKATTITPTTAPILNTLRNNSRSVSYGRGFKIKYKKIAATTFTQYPISINKSMTHWVFGVILAIM